MIPRIPDNVFRGSDGSKIGPLGVLWIEVLKRTYWPVIHVLNEAFGRWLLFHEDDPEPTNLQMHPFGSVREGASRPGKMIRRRRAEELAELLSNDRVGRWRVMRYTDAAR